MELKGDGETTETLHGLLDVAGPQGVVPALPRRRQGVQHPPAVRLQTAVPGTAEHEHRHQAAPQGLLGVQAAAGGAAAGAAGGGGGGGRGDRV